MFWFIMEFISTFDRSASAWTHVFCSQLKRVVRGTFLRY